MPHIHVLLPYTTHGEVFECLLEYRTVIRELFAEAFGYDVDEIALIPRILSHTETELAENILPLEFVSDMGARPLRTLTDHDAETFRDTLLTRCHRLRNIHWGIWLKATPSNGFAEHKSS